MDDISPGVRPSTPRGQRSAVSLRDDKETRLPWLEAGGPSPPFQGEDWGYVAKTDTQQAEHMEQRERLLQLRRPRLRNIP